MLVLYNNVNKYKDYLANNNLTFVDFICVEYLEGVSSLQHKVSFNKDVNDTIEPIFKTYPILERYYKEMMSLLNIQKYRNSDKFLRSQSHITIQLHVLVVFLLKK